MSRSRRKNPVCGLTTARSEKQDKQLSNRAWRRRVRGAIATGREIPDRREIHNVWTFAKDGTQRFDPVKWPEGMRK